MDVSCGPSKPGSVDSHLITNEKEEEARTKPTWDLAPRDARRQRHDIIEYVLILGLVRLEVPEGLGHGC